MVNKCMYCSKKLFEGCVLDVCTPCGHGVWGKKMFSAIEENMKRAEKKGDLHQGSVTDPIGQEELRKTGTVSV